MNCPLATKGSGFVLGTGDPYTAKMMIILEAPGKDEIGFFILPVADRKFFATPQECATEIERRKKSFPDVPEKFLRRGAPIVGMSGAELDMWVLPAVGIQRKDLFIDNTLRCLPPKEKQGYYPKGDERKMAEQCCRHWDRLHQFRPDAMVITLHPAGILREVTPLPLQVKDFEKARDFMRGGKRVAVLLGGKAAKAFLRYGESVTKFRGDYRLLPKDYLQTYKDRFAFVGKKEKKKREKTVNALETLFELGGGAPALKKPKKAKKARTTDGGQDGGADRKRTRRRKSDTEGAGQSAVGLPEAPTTND